MKKILLIALVAGIVHNTFAEGEDQKSQKEYTDRPFKTTRIINGHSTEMLDKRILDVRIDHRFGDIDGDNGGVHTLFGLDQSADIRIAVEYGITDDVNIGFGRSKGAGPWREILDGYAKYRILRQTTDNSMPLSLTFLGTGAYTMMEEVSDATSPAAFQESSHRMAYTSQLLISKKFGNSFSLQLMPTYSHRNLVAFEDENSVVAIGTATHLQITKVMGLLVEYYHGVETRTVGGTDYQNSLGFGFQFDTGGHVFTLNFTNAGGLGENQFIPYTTQEWGEGQYRLGFTISRKFQL